MVAENVDYFNLNIVKFNLNTPISPANTKFKTFKSLYKYFPTLLLSKFYPYPDHACADFYQSLLFPKPEGKSGETLSELKCHSCPLRRIARRIEIS